MLNLGISVDSFALSKTLISTTLRNRYPPSVIRCKRSYERKPRRSNLKVRVVLIPWVTRNEFIPFLSWHPPMRTIYPRSSRQSWPRGPTYPRTTCLLFLFPFSSIILPQFALYHFTNFTDSSSISLVRPLPGDRQNYYLCLTASDSQNPRTNNRAESAMDNEAAKILIRQIFTSYIWWLESCARTEDANQIIESCEYVFIHLFILVESVE